VAQTTLPPHRQHARPVGELDAKLRVGQDLRTTLPVSSISSLAMQCFAEFYVVKRPKLSHFSPFHVVQREELLHNRAVGAQACTSMKCGFARGGLRLSVCFQLPMVWRRRSPSASAVRKFLWVQPWLAGQPRPRLCASRRRCAPQHSSVSPAPRRGTPDVS